jgi:hypothetical protein
MVVKDNHPTLRKKIAQFFAHPGLQEAELYRASEKTNRRGRVETRSIIVSDDVPRGFTGFAGVRQVFRLDRQVISKRTGELRSETVYGMTSLARAWCSPEQLLSLIRQHWTIENRVHWVRDVTMREDASQVRTGSTPQVMVAFRNIALSLLRASGHQNVAAARRFYAARPAEALKLIGVRQITE